MLLSKRLASALGFLVVLGSLGPLARVPGGFCLSWLSPSALACTSFAVYSGETIYGMNFDYPEVEVRLRVRSEGDLRIFELEFQKDGLFIPTVGMNSAGLFASCQLQFPEASPARPSGPNPLFVPHAFRMAISRYRTVSEVLEFFEDRTLAYWWQTLHNLYADRNRDAVVAEVGEGVNRLTSIEGDFIVMTNFPNADFAGLPLTEINGVGADRYRIAHQAIAADLQSFTWEKAFVVLRKTASSGYWPTLCSLVLGPERGEIYVALNREYDRIWKISLNAATIEPLFGPNEGKASELPPGGILASELRGQH